MRRPWHEKGVHKTAYLAVYKTLSERVERLQISNKFCKVPVVFSVLLPIVVLLSSGHLAMMYYDVMMTYACQLGSFCTIIWDDQKASAV